MSADRWGICPKCKKEYDLGLEVLKEEATNCYGKVTATEWLKLVSQVGDPVELDETLREDWEIYMGKDGNFYIGYSCGCNKCGFNFKFKHEENVL